MKGIFYNFAQALAQAKNNSLSEWWKTAVIYQIYPMSFMDGNNDGIGDIKGIIDKLDYLESLGITAVWLNPVYPSPRKDNGYDITDFTDIDSIFGNINEFDMLLSELNKRNIKVIMDLVINHCSEEHPWFVSAKASKSSPFRDYFIWKKPSDGSYPNNWNSFFGNSAWEKVEDEYYLHLFAKEQPDLNWENTKLRNEIYNIIKFWIEKGVDGFRLDAVSLIAKDSTFRNLSDGESLSDRSSPCINESKLKFYLKEMHEKVFKNGSVCLIGETPGIDIRNVLDYVGGKHPLLNMVISSEVIDKDRSGNDKFQKIKQSLNSYKPLINKWQTKLHNKGWSCNFLMNHDQPRSVSRFGDDREFRKESSKVLIMMLLTLEGTPIIYQGEEIGLTNVPYNDIVNYRDIDTIQYWNNQIKIGTPREIIYRNIRDFSRDNARSPMHWNRRKYAGFSKKEPWISVSENYEAINVEESENDPDSILNFTKSMISFRQKSDALVFGSFELIDTSGDKLFSYRRKYKEDTFLIILNFSKVDQAIPVYENHSLVCSTAARTEIFKYDGLSPWEGRIYHANRH